jgi:cytosine deaminase
MDATLSYGLPRVNESGTLLEGIALWGELKPLLKAEAHDRARAGLLRLGRGQGPAGDPQPRRHQRPEPAAVEALLEVKKRVAPYIDLQLVAFPQDGVLRSPAASTT